MCVGFFGTELYYSVRKRGKQNSGTNSGIPAGDTCIYDKMKTGFMTWSN